MFLAEAIRMKFLGSKNIEKPTIIIQFHKEVHRKIQFNKSVRKSMNDFREFFRGEATVKSLQSWEDSVRI